MGGAYSRITSYRAALTEEEFTALCSNFWAQAVWAAKKAQRGGIPGKPARNPRASDRGRAAGPPGGGHPRREEGLPAGKACGDLAHPGAADGNGVRHAPGTRSASSCHRPGLRRVFQSSSAGGFVQERMEPRESWRKFELGSPKWLWAAPELLGLEQLRDDVLKRDVLDP